MEGQEIIRAFLLEPGDVFRIGEIYFKVSKIENGSIYYHYHYPGTHGGEITGKIKTMGANSKEKLILITNKTKQNEHQNRSGNFRKS